MRTPTETRRLLVPHDFSAHADSALKSALELAHGPGGRITVGRTGLSHLLIGSVAEKVVRHASVPVVTIRPKAKRKRPTR